MARLRDEYNKTIRGDIMKEFGFSNMMEVPTLSKIVVNVGAGDAIREADALEDIIDIVTSITGQKPLVTKRRRQFLRLK